MAKNRILAKREGYRISALGDLTRGIPKELELDRSLKYALRSMMGALAVSAGAIVTFSKGEIDTFQEMGFSIHGGDLRLDPQIHDYFAKRTMPLTTRNGRIDKRVRGFFTRIGGADGGIDFVSPIKMGGDLVGLVILGRKIDGTAPSRKDLELLGVMSHYVAAEINSRRVVEKITDVNRVLSEKVHENLKLVSSLKSVYFQTIMALAAAIDAKDPYTRGHSERVAKISREVARMIGMKSADVNSVYMAGILHDVGKIATERKVLKKVGALTERERNHVMEHPKVSHRILSKVKFPDPGIALYALYHHEWYDGSGYPFGKGGDEIPLGARILSLADSFDAMVANRPYRDGKDLEGAIGEIDRWSGKQFDPVVVSAFFQVVENEVSGKVARPVVIPLVQNGEINRAVRACLKRYLSKPRRKSRGKLS